MRSPDRRSDAETDQPMHSPAYASRGPSPLRQESPSPTKSALARVSQFGVSLRNSTLDPGADEWSEGERGATPRAAHRLAKSVTFHQAPPVVNEYEQQTPEPSMSVASDRDGSWDSDEFYDQDVSFDRGSSVDREREDSFDADLENAEKTPVVLPEDWTGMSPDEAQTDLVDKEDDVFESSPGIYEPSTISRSASGASDGESRPLPPLPAFLTEGKRRDSGGLTAAAERAAFQQKNSHTALQRPSCSKEEILKITTDTSLTPHDRLRLMAGSSKEVESTQVAPSEPVERGVPEELTITNLDTGEKMEVLVRVAEAPVEDESVVDDLPDFTSPPRISRESILRKVRNTKYDFEDEDDLEDSYSADQCDNTRPSYAELAMMDPDQPIPSRENSRETSDNNLARQRHAANSDEYEVEVKQERSDDEAVNMAGIPEVYNIGLAPPRSPSRMEDYERQSSVLHNRELSEYEDEDTDDDCSRYSNSVEPEAESTPVDTQSHMQEAGSRETLQDAMQLLSVKDYSSWTVSHAPAKSSGGSFMGLPAYLSSNDYDFGMGQYMAPSPPASNETTKHLGLENAPVLAPPFEHYQPGDTRHDAASIDISPPATPDSVIHRSSDRISEVSALHDSELEPPQPVRPESPEIPERKATIKTGGRLKARPSATPADFETMAQQRRTVSSEHRIPPLAPTYQSELGPLRQESEAGSIYSSASDVTQFRPDSLHEHSEHAATVNTAGRRESRQMQLKVDIPSFESADKGGLSLDAEFDKVIESQKVRMSSPPFGHARCSALLEYR